MSENPYLAAFGMMVNALDNKKGGDGDTGAMFPRSDAADMSAGAAYIPGEVTDARRSGKKVKFVQKSRNPSEWFWSMPDGKKVMYEV